MPGRPLLTFFAAAAAAMLIACTASPQAAPGLRVMVKLSAGAASGTPGTATVAAWAAQATGLPVTAGAAVSPVWHALNLACGAATCEAALRALAADTAHFDSVEPETRRRAH